jgi:hypothetical protein
VKRLEFITLLGGAAQESRILQSVSPLLVLSPRFFLLLSSCLQSIHFSMRGSGIYLSIADGRAFFAKQTAIISGSN